MKNGTPLAANGDGKFLNGNCHHHKLNGGTTVYVRPPPPGRLPEKCTEYTCGIGSFRPRWLQPFANKKSFLAVFCLTSVLQGMYYTYFVSVLTTIEKLYQIPSKTTGFIMAITEVGQIGGSLVLTYYGGRGNRPLWISCGMVIFALASILCSTPHFLFGVNDYYAELENQSDTLQSYGMCRGASPTFLHHLASNSSKISEDFEEMDNVSQHFLDSRTPFRLNARCGAEEHNENIIVLAIMFISLLFIGVGATAVYTLGIPYIDDNVATKESPLYFAITIGVRIFGPVFGFLLGSLCTSVPINFPFEPPKISTEDPNWLGAWWLGVFIVGFCLILTSFFMMAFPRKLPKSSKAALVKYSNVQNERIICDSKHYLPPSIKDVYRPSLSDFLSTMKRLFRNNILLLRTASSVLHILPIAGLYTFLPKYLENQYRLTAAKANAIAGLAGILVMGIGIFGSGIYLRCRKPDARFVARWIAATTLLYAAGMVVLMFVGCPLENYVGLNAGSQDQMIASSCAESCQCKTGEFSPICTTEGVVFLSPCLAGCTTATPISKGQSYNNCACMDPEVTAVSGFCPQKCDALVLFIIIFSSIVLVNSTSEVGSMLLTLRCVEPTDKSMALGLISFAIGLFGNVPCPVIYGSVVDSACLFWEERCGQRGACRVYDPVKFRVTFHGLTALIMFVAFLIDLVVYCKSAAIDFHARGEDNASEGPTAAGPRTDEEPGETEPMNLQPQIAHQPAYAQFESNV